MSSYTTRQMIEDSCNLHVMNEKVQNLASNVYKEFEIIISQYGPNTVKSLMPVVVSILESLDQNLKDKQKFEIDLELSRVEIEHLRNQCDKEKGLRRSADLKFLEMEDLVEETKKQFNQFKSNSDLSNKRSEMKLKNLQEHINRLEEKENKAKDDYSKLHVKYSDLLKSHADYVHKTSSKHHHDHNEQRKCLNCNRTDFEITTDPIINPAETIVVDNQQLNILQNDSKFDKSKDVIYSGKTLQSEINEIESSYFSTSLTDESTFEASFETTNSHTTLDNSQTDKKCAIDSANNIQVDHINSPISPSLLNKNNSALVNPNAYIDSPDSYPSTIHSQEDLNQENKTVDALFGECIMASNAAIGKQPFLNSLDNFAEKNTTDEASLHYDNMYTNENLDDHLKHLMDIEEDVIVDPSNITNINSEYDPVKNVSLYEELSLLDEDVGADLVSVGAEVDKLIQENAELLATKNALNVLKDDLIADVEELSGEVELLKEEIQSLTDDKNGLTARITELEEELKKCREEMKQIQAKYEEQQQDEMGKTTFSRAELVRVLMERNQYKEKWMELQEAVRWAETVRASRAHPELMNAPAETRKSRTSAVWGFFNSFLGKEKDDG